MAPASLVVHCATRIIHVDPLLPFRQLLLVVGFFLSNSVNIAVIFCVMEFLHASFVKMNDGMNNDRNSMMAFIMTTDHLHISVRHLVGPVTQTESGTRTQYY